MSNDTEPTTPLATPLVDTSHVDGGEQCDWSESPRWFADVNKHVRVEGHVCNVYQSVLQTVETVELKPSGTRVQQFCPVSTC